MSTGTGPFTYYHSLNGARRARPSRPFAVGASAREIARLEKAEQAKSLYESLQAIGRLHMQDFPPARRLAAEMAGLPDFSTVLADAEREALRGISLLKPGLRREARTRARGLAEERARALLTDAQSAQREQQAELDSLWDRLVANDHEVVLSALAAAFEDNEAPAAAVGVENSEVLIVVLAPGVGAVPERLPTTTDAGNLSIRKMTKSTRHEYHRQVVAGYAVVSAKETFAVAPGVERVSVVVLQSNPDRANDSSTAVPVLVTRLHREALVEVPPAPMGAWDLVERCGSDNLVHLKGVAQELRPLDLAAYPELADIAGRVEFGRRAY